MTTIIFEVKQAWKHDQTQFFTDSNLMSHDKQPQQINLLLILSCREKVIKDLTFITFTVQESKPQQNPLGLTGP